MIDLFELNDIVNEAGVIVMPGQLRNTTTQLLLVSGEHLMNETYWSIFPSVYDNLNQDELAVLVIIVHNLYPVMHTTPIGNVQQAITQCKIKNNDKIIDSLKQNKLVKEVSGNYFVNHKDITIATQPSPPKEFQSVPQSTKIIPFSFS